MAGPGAVDLTTTYLGLRLSSPIVASASPVTRELDGSKALADAGVGAIVLPSLFEEEIVAEEVGLSFALEAGREHFAEALDYFPDTPTFTTAADRYLELLEQTKKAVDVPVIASLNASSIGGWSRYARLLADAGADALELNVYRVPTDPDLNAAQVEQIDLALVSNVCAGVSLPVAVKLSPYYSAMASFAARVLAAGPPAWSCSTAFTSPTWTWRRWTWCLGWSCPGAGNCACRCAGSPSCGPSSGRSVTGGDVRHPYRDRCSEGPGRGGRRGHDDVRHPAARGRPMSSRSSPNCAAGWPTTSTPRSQSCGGRCPRRPRATPAPSNGPTT